MKHKAAITRFVIDAFHLMEREKFYTQAEILGKMKLLNTEISPASFSNILAGKSVGIKSLLKAQRGLEEIVSLELGKTYEASTCTFVQIPEWEAEIIDSRTTRDSATPPFIFHEHGRLTIQEKVSRMNMAQKEVVEFGVRLRAFTDYFHSRSTHEFGGHIEALLEKGVSLKLFFVDPESNRASIYFEDRGIFLPAENDSVEIIRKVKEQLLKIREGLNSQGYKGNFEVYTYKHIPGAHYLMIDGSSRQGKLVVSHYLYATKRADSPTLEINKTDNPDLYRKYYKAVKALMQDAKPI